MMLPKIAINLLRETSNLGGWLVGLSDDLLKIKAIELTVCFPVVSQKELLIGQVDNLKYYGFPQKISNPTIYNHEVEIYLNKILNEVSPDIIHIFGTEYPHTLAMMNACENLGMLDQVVINIQGLASICAKHYGASLPDIVRRKYTFRDFVKQDNMNQQATKFQKRGKFEIQALQMVKHVIGRTDWDKACTEQINPNAAYHFCNETLRDEFYRHNWDINSCEKHSIFISQCSYPIKGFHFMLEAMPEILRKYPNAHIYTTGKNPLLLTGLGILRETYYQKYIGNLIKKYKLQDKITFLGSLDEHDMCERYLKSHVFISPSSIENSPNSVGEAMILGVPTVTSDVGGVKNMLTHNEDGFIYQYDAPYMLAYNVCKIFEDNDLALKFSECSKKHAQITHNREINLKAMLEIYEEINSK